MIHAIPFYMIRHGESEANLGQFCSGHVDVALTEKGVNQARKAALVVAALAVKPSLIIHSHLQRARITAQIINEKLNVEMIEDAEIAEQMYGDWEGVGWAETRQPLRDGIDPPNGETHAAFNERVRTTISKYILEYEKSAPVMFVCHGGVFRAIGNLYKQKIHGVENCALHHFAPDMANDIFPWKIEKFTA
jgi:broad specificity phosphatase PhoE